MERIPVLPLTAVQERERELVARITEKVDGYIELLEEFYEAQTAFDRIHTIMAFSEQQKRLERLHKAREALSAYHRRESEDG